MVPRCRGQELVGKERECVHTAQTLVLLEGRLDQLATRLQVRAHVV